MASMWYSKEAGGFVRRVPGTDRVIKVGGAEDTQMSQESLQQKRQLADSLSYSKNKDYSAGFSGLFGADTGGDFHYSGPNARWTHAMEDRLGNRMKGDYDNAGWYENSTRTMDPELQRQMANRNNTIEAMMRQGYSQSQMMDHMAGKSNALEAGPDFADYNKHKEEYMATLGDGQYERQWFDDYYQGAPGQTNPQTPTWVRPSASTGGFLGGYKDARQPNLQGTPNFAENTVTPSSVASLFDSFMNKRRGQ